MIAKKQIPLGSSYAQLTTISEPFIEQDKHVRRSFVKVHCSCGREYEMRTSHWGKIECCRTCSNRKLGTRSFRGHDHPRQPVYYRVFLVHQQKSVCAWPLCGKLLEDNIVTDHNRRISPGDRTTYQSLRGAVHARCNEQIKYADWAIENGFLAPPAVEKYLRRGESLSEENPIFPGPLYSKARRKELVQSSTASLPRY